MLKVSQQRQKQGKFPVTIKFWQDVCDWLSEFPDLGYKHFTKHFPTQELETVHVSNLNQLPRSTATWPITLTDWSHHIDKTIHGITKTEPYKPVIGITTFADVVFNELVDLEIQLAPLYADELQSEADFITTAKIFNQVKAIIRNSYFAQEIWLYPQVRLPVAFLLGWVFRRVSNFELRLIFHDQIWVTGGLPFVQPRLSEGLPHLGDPKNKEVALILNLSRNIESSALEFINTWEQQPLATLTYNLDSHRVTSAAHAMSLAITISQKIKTIIDKWGVRRIHLFGAMPAALATLIGFNLNAICPISIYFLDSTRSQYQIGGTLTNNL